jgi:A/G-specific adenine glycosylase
VAAERTSALLDWYRDNGRNLPWRSTNDPWPILVSEVMSQQTQISRVVPAWTAFMARYPTPGDLARSDRAELIRLWAGLGYQRRALNLQRAAGIVAEKGWPTTVDGLRELPGVGPYTAAAVACFAFGVPIPAIDTNLKRILSRWHGTPLDPAALAAAAASELPHDDAAAWSQALMDLGSELCRPREPRCSACPVTEWCLDPTIYEAPPRQSRYEGSVRQARAAILKTLAKHGPTDLAVVVASTGLDRSTLDAAANALEQESTLVRVADLISLASS